MINTYTISIYLKCLSKLGLVPNTIFHASLFADDTIFLCEESWDNLRGLKTILRSFEFVTGLTVNFHKSKLIGVNVKAASSFLACQIEPIPFKFFGIQVGENLRRRSTWNPIIELMQKKF